MIALDIRSKNKNEKKKGLEILAEIYVENAANEQIVKKQNRYVN